jgi:LysM repeat protein
MSNPFIAPGSLLIERERQRREKFKLGVYAILGIFALSLIGMLIQGCKHQDTFADADTTSAAGAESNTPPSFVPPTPDSPSSEVASTPSVPAPITPSAPVPSAPSVAAEQPAPAPAPVAAQPTPTPAPDRVYVVKQGDSLFSIAHAHGTTVNALRSANGLKKDSLSLGQKLKLPAAKVTLASASRH